MDIKVSILISSYNRLPLFRRTLWSIANRPPSLPFEVVVADEMSTEPILDELKKYSFPWKFITVDINKFTEKTGIVKYHNNPSLTNNIAWSWAKGDYIFLMGNECIAVGNCFDKMIEDAKKLAADYYIIFSTTFDLRPEILNKLDEYGTNLSNNDIIQSSTWPLQSESYHSDVTNYISLSNTETWWITKGYDERYLGGLACDDSDFVRRVRAIPNAKTARSTALSLHQFHGGKTRYYEPVERGMTTEKWNKGVEINRKIYHEWDGSYMNPQTWRPGQFGADINNIIDANYD